MYQSITVVGHLGKKPEVRYLDSGQAVAKFSVAATDKYINKAGDKVESTEWFNVELWGKTAEVAEKYLDKGSLVMIIGQMKTEKYVKDGQDHYATKLRGRRMQMLSRSEPSTQPQAEQSQAKPETSPQAEYTDIPPPELEDDLPF